MGKSKKHEKPNFIVRVARGNSTFYPKMPVYLNLAHKHLEKAKASPVKTLGSGENSLATFQVPVDLIGMVLPADITNDIESFEVTYRRGRI